jgi:hypothetical protein
MFPNNMFRFYDTETTVEAGSLSRRMSDRYFTYKHCQSAANTRLNYPRDENDYNDDSDA